MGISRHNNLVVSIRNFNFGFLIKIIHGGDVKNLKVPKGATGIGDRAFSECYSLTSIDLPESVTSIGD